MWTEITYQFPNVNGFTIEVLGWISQFSPHFIIMWLFILGRNEINLKRSSWKLDTAWKAQEQKIILDAGIECGRFQAVI